MVTKITDHVQRGFNLLFGQYSNLGDTEILTALQDESGNVLQDSDGSVLEE